MSIEVREATPADAGDVASIHEEAIIAGNATFRTEPRPVADVATIIALPLPFLVAEMEGAVVGWAATGPYEESNPYYSGVGEVAVYVARDARGEGIGGALLEALALASSGSGMFKLVAKVFDTNRSSLRLFQRAGYAEVGTHLRHGKVRGEWKDVLVYELLLGESRPGER